MSDPLNNTVGLLLISGGLYAFIKKGSLPSLIGGSFIGSLYLLTSY